MKKKVIAVLLAAAMVFSVAGCGASGGDAGSADSSPEEAQEEDASEEDASEDAKIEELNRSMEDSEDSEEAQKEEGYVTEGDGYTGTVRWCKNGEKNIFGTLYVPADYDGTKTYPTMVMSHGFGDCHTAYDAYIPTLAAKGIVCYVFDFCTGGLKSFSDGEATDYSVMTETEDLHAVIDFVKEQDCVDSSKLMLAGQSMGGLVASLVAAQRPDEIAELILFYPALMEAESIHEDYPTAEDLPTEETTFLKAKVGPRFFSDIYDVDVYGTIGAYTGPVLLLHGTGDILVPVSVSERALEVYQNAELKIIEDANHGFPPLEDGTNVRELACGYIVDFLAENGVIQ